MASKPLHVRRLQKSLHEWVNNPSLFQMPLSSSIGRFFGISHFEGIFHFTFIIYLDSTQQPFSPEPAQQSQSPFNTSQTYSPSSITGNSSNIASFSHISNLSSITTSLGSQPSSSSSSSLQLTPSLTEIQVTRLAAAAERFV